MNALSLALFLIAVTPGSPARPPATTSADASAGDRLTEAQVEEMVNTYLGAIDTPITAAQWKALGARGVTHLSSIATGSASASTGAALPSRRAHAVDALTLIGGSTAKKVVLSLATTEGSHKVVRAHALRGAGRLLSSAELSAQLTPVLKKASDPTVRATAAEVLAQHAPSSACAAVRAQANQEESALRPKFSRALERCGVSP